MRPVEAKEAGESFCGSLFNDCKSGRDLEDMNLTLSVSNPLRGDKLTFVFKTAKRSSEMTPT